MTLQRKANQGQNKADNSLTVHMKLASSNAACHCDLCLPDEVKINLDMKDPTTFKKNNSKPEKNQRP